MRIILKEMKKMLNLKAILLLTAFTLLFFIAFLKVESSAFDNEYYYNTLGAELDIYKDLVSKIGPVVSSDNAKQFDSIYEEQYKILDAVVQEYDELKREGIETFHELALHSSDTLELNKIYRDIINSKDPERTMDIIEFIRNSTIRLSEQEAEEFVTVGWGDSSEWYIKKMKELYMSDKISLLPERIVEDSFGDIGFLAIWITICCLIIVLPYRVNENLSGVKSVGISAKKGRNLYVKQWLAAMMSSLLIAFVQLILYAVCLYKAGYLSFWQCPNMSRGNLNLYWIDMSYGTHLLVYAILIILFSAIAGTVFFLISGANSYMRAISFGVPCCAFLAFMAWMVFDNLFSIPEAVFLKLSELYVIGVLFITVSFILYFSIKKNRTEDVKETL